MSKDLGPIEIVGAEAIGQPGQRRLIEYWHSLPRDVYCAPKPRLPPQRPLEERLPTFQLNPNLSSRSANCASVMMRGAICWY